MEFRFVRLLKRPPGKKTLLPLVVLGGMALTFLACKKKDGIECAERELQTVSFGFESGLDAWESLGGNIEIKDSAYYEMSDDTAYSGVHSAKFIVSMDSYLNSGVRSELSFDQQIEAGDETIYEYSFFIPTDYQDVASLKASDGAPNWQIMGQWHDQPDVCTGETWDDLAGNSPPIALYYNYLSRSDPEYIDLLADPQTGNIYGFDPAWDNVSTIGLEYGGKPIAIAEVTKGEWYRMKYQIKWSTEGDGYIQAWINNANFTNGKVAGENMLNNASHYFKFGLYRNPTISSVNAVYYDDLEIY